MKQTKIYLTSILMILLFALTTNAQFGLERDFDPRVSNWYDIQDWEVEVCKLYGGTEIPLAISNNQNLFLSQNTYTLQVNKEELPDETIIFKISHYIQPLQDDVDFAIRLRKPQSNQNLRIIGRTNVDQGQSHTDFDTKIESVDYDIAQLRIDDFILTVDIVDEDHSGTCESCGTSQTSDTSWDDW
jgi:hypothetical protein